jgi:hypothetical protein
MAYLDYTRRFLLAFFCTVLICLNARVVTAQVAIESGEWISDYLQTWWWAGYWLNADERMEKYCFYAQPYETVIIKLGTEDNHYTVPDFMIYNPSAAGEISSVSTANWTSLDNEHYLAVTNRGWYQFVCSLPVPVFTNVYTNLYTSYNCSILRVPNMPLSYQDEDVGTLLVGNSDIGEINVSADLDAGFFAVTNNRTTMQIRMGQKDYALVPNLKIYGPDGTRVTNDFPSDYRSEITSTLTNQGVYTVVCSDKFNAKGQYALTLVLIPGTVSGSDMDIGTIISGEKKTGTINQPGDLDLASFSVVSGDVVTITMQDIDVDMIPVMEFYGPTGVLLARTTDVFETRAVINNYAITSNGIYSVICKDKEDRTAVSYTLQMDLMAGSPSLANLPATPASITASQGSYSNRIDVTWSVGSGATGYDLWRSYSTNESVQLYTNVTTITYADYNVVTGVYYYYKVKSRNTYGTSTNFSPSVAGYCGTFGSTAKRNVLIVGIDNYSASYGPTPLTTCTNDAAGMRDIFFLGDPSNRWASTNISVFTDKQATKLTIQGALQSLAAASSAGDIVVYVHSSHGGWLGGTYGGSNTYLCTYDANYTATEFAGDLTSFNSETKIIVILDACYSGGMYRLKDATPPPWPFAEEAMAHYRQIKAAQLKKQGLAVPKELGNNIAFMTACNYDELSYTSSFYSRYMGYLISGCNIQSVDTNSSGQYSFLELHDYAATKSVEETPAQHAQTYHPSVLSENKARAVGTNNQSLVSRIRYNDFDGDAYSDIAIYNAATGAWRIGSLHRWMVLAWDVFWGGSAYRPIIGDYDGDRASDLAVYSESLGNWSIASLKRQAVILSSASFGGPNFRPVAGDYNGDGIYDGALFQYPEGFWYIVSSVGVPLVWGTTLTGTGFVPVSGDYDGDMVSDLAMYSSAACYWYIMSMNGTAISWGTSWGVANATPVSGDFDGDGCSDIGVYQESTGLWYIWSIKRQATLANALYFGGPGFLPVPGDYDGDGSCDMVLYHESTGNWHLRTVSGSLSGVINFGGPGWVPVLPTW